MRGASSLQQRAGDHPYFDLADELWTILNMGLVVLFTTLICVGKNAAVHEAKVAWIVGTTAGVTSTLALLRYFINSTIIKLLLMFLRLFGLSIEMGPTKEPEKTSVGTRTSINAVLSIGVGINIACLLSA